MAGQLSQTFTKEQLEDHFDSMQHGPGRVPSGKQILGYVLNSVSPVRKAEIANHLSRCTKCRLIKNAAEAALKGHGLHKAVG